MSGKRLEIKQIDKSQRKKNKQKLTSPEQPASGNQGFFSAEAKPMLFERQNQNFKISNLQDTATKHNALKRFFPLSGQETNDYENDSEESHDFPHGDLTS